MKKQIKKSENKVVVEVSNNEVKVKGRPVNMNSARQKRLAELASKREAGELKRGRPVVKGSARQRRLAEQAYRKALNGGVAKLGRPKALKEADEQK